MYEIHYGFTGKESAHFDIKNKKQAIDISKGLYRVLSSGLNPDFFDNFGGECTSIGISGPVFFVNLQKKNISGYISNPDMLWGGYKNK